ncbi:D2MP protein, partial [Acromyrmex insinuator]
KRDIARFDTSDYPERNGYNPDILISYRSGTHTYANRKRSEEICSASFDGPGGVLAHAFYPSNVVNYTAEIHVDAAEPWHIYLTEKSASNKDYLLNTLTHEIGHALGLTHSSHEDSIMFAYVTARTSNRTSSYRTHSRNSLTATGYKYLNIGINVTLPSCVTIILGDCHGKEIPISPDIWKELLQQKHVILSLLQYDENNKGIHAPSPMYVGNLTLRFGRINNLPILRLETSTARLSMSKSTVLNIFNLEHCVNRLISSIIILYLQRVRNPLVRARATARTREEKCANLLSRSPALKLAGSSSSRRVTL